jgi:hypothetical protein
MKTNKIALLIIVGFVSVFSILVAEGLMFEADAKSVTEIQTLKDQDSNDTGSNSWDMNVPNFNPYDNKGLGGGGSRVSFGGGGLLGGI